MKKLLLLLPGLILFCSCQGQSTTSLDDAKSTTSTDGLSIIATTGQINSALMKITAGTNVTIKLFCGPGVDPHSYSASTKDVESMLNCDLIFYNGFHLEAKLSDYLNNKFKNKAWAMSTAFPDDVRLDWVEDGEIDPDSPYDPHIWNHLPGWIQCVRGMTSQLADADPANSERYLTNSKAYIQEIEETHAWAQKLLAELPENHRVIISSHDAFNYFAALYDMESLAVLGIGNDPEADIQTMRKVAEQICDRKIPVMFMESITNPKVVTALKEACQSRDWNVTIVDQPIYSDDLGATPPQNTFLGAFRSNVQLICDSLNPNG